MKISAARQEDLAAIRGLLAACGLPHDDFEDGAVTFLVARAGNGLAGAAGVAPCPTEEQSTLVKDAVWVGAHDNGHVAAWSCAPAHVVADGYGGPVAGNHTIDGFGPSPFACCTHGGRKRGCAI